MKMVESDLLAGMGVFPWHLECHHHFPHPSGHALFIRYSCAGHTLDIRWSYAGDALLIRYSIGSIRQEC